jgi:hypothetical protein
MILVQFQNPIQLNTVVSNKFCNYCKKKNHTLDQCWKLKNKNKNSKNPTASYSIFNSSFDSKINCFNYILDSGASHNFLKDINLIMDFQPINLGEVNLADNSTVKIMGKGKFPFANEILECLYVPALRKNLISVNQLVKKNFIINFNTSGCEVISPSKMVINFRPKKDIYIYQASNNNFKQLLHSRMGHINEKTLSIILKRYPTIYKDKFKKLENNCGPISTQTFKSLILLNLFKIK